MDWQVIKLIGKGSQGRVFHVIIPNNKYGDDEDFALKIVNKDYINTNKIYKEQFKNEIEI